MRNKRFNKVMTIAVAAIMLMGTIAIAGINTCEVKAATTGADKLVTEAQKYKNMNKSQVKSKMASAYAQPNGAWCAWFVSACAQKTGLKAKIPQSNVVGYLAKNVASANKTKIVFLNSNAYNYAKKGTSCGPYCVLASSTNNKLQKGDIVIESSVKMTSSDSPWCHVGIMTSSTTAIFGNDGVGVVKERSVTIRKDASNGTFTGRVVAYVRPSYSAVQAHTHSFDHCTGLCSCGARYWANVKVDATNATDPARGVFYRVKTATAARAYPATTGKVLRSDMGQGFCMRVFGITSDQKWYKVKYNIGSNDIGYVPVSDVEKYTPTKEQSLLWVAPVDKQTTTYTIKSGETLTIDATVCSNYPLKSIEAILDGHRFTDTNFAYSETYKRTIYLKDTSAGAAIRSMTSSLSDGEHPLVVEARDWSDKLVTLNMKILVNVQAPAEPESRPVSDNPKAAAEKQNVDLYENSGSDCSSESGSVDCHDSCKEDNTKSSTEFDTDSYTDYDTDSFAEDSTPEYSPKTTLLSVLMDVLEIVKKILLLR